MKKHKGSNFEDFLAEEGILEECTARAEEARKRAGYDDISITIEIDGVKHQVDAAVLQLVHDVSVERDELKRLLSEMVRTFNTCNPNAIVIKESKEMLYG